MLPSFLFPLSYSRIFSSGTLLNNSSTGGLCKSRPRPIRHQNHILVPHIDLALYSAACPSWRWATLFGCGPRWAVLPRLTSWVYPGIEIRVFLLLDRLPFRANELYLPKEPSNIQLAPKPKYGDTPSPSSGDLCICTPDEILKLDRSKDPEPLSYLSDLKHFLCQLDDEKK